jgi:hypothetical protein
MIMSAYKLYIGSIFSKEELKKEKPINLSLVDILSNPQASVVVDAVIKPRDNFEKADYKKGGIITGRLAVNYGPSGDAPLFPFMLFINSPESVRTNREQGITYALDHALDGKKFYPIISKDQKNGALRETSKIMDRLLFVGDIDNLFAELKEKRFIFSKDTFEPKERGKKLESLFKKFQIYHMFYNPVGKEYRNTVLESFN